jgi:tristetraprolin
MPSRTENSDRALANSHRWRLNSSGQLVDTEADGPWEIVDEMNRINLNGGTPDTEDVRPIRTPPKSKLSGSNVAPIIETSPLDSSSSNSTGSSPNVPEHPISHSRGSSADTTTSSARDSVGGNPLLAHPPLKVAPVETKERPHSFSGGISSMDLRRLQQVGDSDHDRQIQQQQWAQSQYREGNAEQLSYPSLANQVHRPLPQHAQQSVFNYPPSALQPQQRLDSEREGPQLDYNHQQQQQLRRNFNPVPVHGPGTAAPPPQFVQGRANNANQSAINYRNVRGFPAGPNPAALIYPPNHHTSHLSLGNTQQLYEMMLPAPPHDNHNPAVTRVQQQHNIFRATHHHSASDPSAIRDAATLALMQNFTPNMFQPGMPTMSLYPNQYYGAQELAVQQAMAARLQPQYSTPYNVAAAQNLPGETGSPTSSSGQTGPSANNRKLGLYKTELCRSWEEKGTCRYGTKCQFAHGEDELRTVSRHPKVGVLSFNLY